MSSLSEEIAVELRNVSKIYQRENEAVHALDQFSLQVKKGEFLALAGPSGSGKSTALHLIGALDVPSSGEILLSGKSIESLSEAERTELRREQLGFVFQSFNLIPVLTASENVDYVLQLQGLGAEERKQRVEGVLKAVGLGDRAHHYPAQLSGGQQQRVAIARAIVGHPALVLADEPTANLDSRTGLALIEMMIELNEQKSITFVFSTHDQKILDKAHRVVLLEDGRRVS